MFIRKPLYDSGLRNWHIDRPNIFFGTSENGFPIYLNIFAFIIITPKPVYNSEYK